MDDNYKQTREYEETEKEEITLNKREIEIISILIKYSFKEIKELYEKISIKVAKNIINGDKKC